MQRRNRQVRRRLQPHGDLECSTFLFSILNIDRQIMPLSARTLPPRRRGRGEKQIQRISRRALRLGGESFYPCTESRNGCSNASAIQRRNRAASAPSINR